MARIFSECVILRSPETGEPAVFLPGSPVPGWAESLVTNPAVTVGAPDEVTTDTEESDAGAPASADQAEEDGKTEEEVSDESTSPVTRPYGNATKNEWADYATSLGVKIPDGATKNEIIALVDALPATE